MKTTFRNLAIVSIVLILMLVAFLPTNNADAAGGPVKHLIVLTDGGVVKIDGFDQYGKRYYNRWLSHWAWWAPCPVVDPSNWWTGRVTIYAANGQICSFNITNSTGDTIYVTADASCPFA